MTISLQSFIKEKYAAAAMVMKPQQKSYFSYPSG